MSIIQMESQSLMDFEIFAKIAFLTFDLGPRSKVMAPNESPYMISYMSTIQTESVSLTVFEIFEKNADMTFDLGPRSKVKYAIFANNSKSMRARDSICIIDI